MAERRRAKRRRVNEPPPVEAPNDAVFEAITVVTCTLNRVAKSAEVRDAIRRCALEIAVLRKRVAMLYKELALAMLEDGEDPPEPTHGLFSGLATSVRSGRWRFDAYDAVLRRHAVPGYEPSVSKTLTCHAMALCARKTAAELKTHYQEHYERFYARWKRLGKEWSDGSPPADGDALTEKIRKARTMRRDLEDAGGRGFALFPEAQLDVRYATLDASCLACVCRAVRPDVCRGKSIADMAAENADEICAELFNVRLVRKLARGRHFRCSIQTDGYGAALSFGRWVQYVRKNRIDESGSERSERAAKRAKIAVAVASLRPGFEYSAAGKTLASLGDLRGVTVRAVDPGVHRAYTSVDLLTDEPDVRRTKLALRTKAWRARIRTRKFAAKQERWRDAALADVQKRLDETPHRTSAYRERYAAYVDRVREHWDALWAFAAQTKRRKLRFRARCVARRELDRETDRLTRPRPGTTHTVLIFGDGARRNAFGVVRRAVRGPAKALHDHAVRTRKAIVVWADEFRTSKLDVGGEKLVHPIERRPNRIPVAANRADGGGTRKRRQHDVCHERRSGRAWNRDVSAAINIGCLFLARALGLDAGPWSRTGQEKRSWAEIFAAGLSVAPFSLPAAKPALARERV